jgi:peptidyl-tRNA hydrolase
VTGAGPEPEADDDPFRMFLVLRKGAIETQARACELGGAAAVACVRRFDIAPEWRARPGKICLRARNPSQWEQALGEDHALAGDADGESVIAIPPRRRSERGPVLSKLQAMSSELQPLPADATGEVVFVVNPRYPMSSGKLVAQVAHAAVMAANTGSLESWVAGGCRAGVMRPEKADAFDGLCTSEACVAKVEDAGLTEVPPGTITVVALAP